MQGVILLISACREGPILRFFMANDGVDLSHVARAFYPRVLIDDKVIAKWVLLISNQ